MVIGNGDVRVIITEIRKRALHCLLVQAIKRVSCFMNAQLEEDLRGVG